MLTELSTKNFSKFRDNLLSYSNRFNIRYEDAEEIVNDSILKALDHFDNEKGSFEGLCKVILKRKIFNFKRDNVYLLLLICIDENEVIIKADDISFEEKENNALALTFLNKLNNLLDEGEAKLLSEIYNTCDSLNKISISKASKNIGLEALKGWDIFRKIQRKAKTLQETAGEEIILISKPKKIIRNPEFYRIVSPEKEFDLDKLKLLILGETSVDNPFTDPFSFLNTDQIRMLNSIYDFS